MAKKTLKLVDENDPDVGLKPPRPLGKHGMHLWNAVHREYHLNDAAGIEMLAQACASLDRAERCAAIIAKQGELLNTRSGPRDNPLLKTELGCRSFVVRTLGRLGLDAEPIGRIGRPTNPFGIRGIADDD